MLRSNMGSNVFELKILFKIHCIAQHNKRKEIKKYNHQLYMVYYESMNTVRQVHN